MPTITNAHMQLISKGLEVTITCTYDLNFTKDEMKASTTKYNEWILLKGVDVGEPITHTGGNIISWDYVWMFPSQSFLPPQKNAGNPLPRKQTITIARWRLVEDQYRSDDEIQCEIRVLTGSPIGAKSAYTNVATLKKISKPWTNSRKPSLAPVS